MPGREEADARPVEPDRYRASPGGRFSTRVGEHRVGASVAAHTRALIADRGSSMHATETSSRPTTRVGSSISRSCAPEGMLMGPSFAIALTEVGTSVLTGGWNFLAGA